MPFFFQGTKDTVADDDVIEHLDPDILAGFDQLFRCPNVFRTRLWIAGRMIVDENDGVGRMFNREPKDFARVKDAGVQRAFKNRIRSMMTAPRER